MVIKNSAIHELRQVASLRSRVETSLASAIISGKLAPGTLITVPTLAAQFAVSATPVREAILDLEKRGFVELVKNKGFRVTDVSDQDLEEIVQIRRLLEGPAMRIVAERLRGTGAESLRAQADRIALAASNVEFEDYIAADSVFHLSLLRLTENERLIDLVTELRKQTRMVGLVNLSRTAELEESVREHYQLLELLQEGDGISAENLTRHHIGHVLGWWAGLSESAENRETV